MSILDLFRWIQDTAPMTALRESALVYPIIMTGHLTGMALFGGMIAITDLRLLGWAMRSTPVSDVIEQLRLWKQIGFVLVVGCGAMLLGSKAELYYYNPFYWTKMALLFLVGVHALAFRSVYRNSAAFPGKAKLAACLSLLIWIGLVTAGRSIAYWDVPENLTPIYGSNSPTTHHARP
jgi:hypothetical protein